MKNVHLASDDIVIQAPMSYTGSARRIWKLTRASNPAARAALMVVALPLVAVTWVAVTAWYAAFGLLLVPYRLLRRGSRRRKIERRQQAQMLEDARAGRLN